MRRLALLILCACLPLSACDDQESSGLEHFPTQLVERAAVASTLTATPTGDVPVADQPTITPLPYPQISARAPQTLLGHSVEGRDILAWRFGDGPTHIVLIGGIHGGYEFNTVLLSQMLIAHFDQNPYDLLPGVRLVIVPLANPDGVVRGGGLEGRLNAHSVDLNRNWDCDWSAKAVWGTVPVDPGVAPDSEPETQALKPFLQAQSPDVVVFYHSSLGIIAIGECGGLSPGQDWLPDLLSRATGYPPHRFDYYQVTGDAANWLAKQGVPAVVIELSTKDQPEFRRNLAGVIALECHFARRRLPDAANVPAVQRLCPS